MYNYLNMGEFFCVATTEQKLCCENQTHAFHLPGVYQAALGGVDTGGVDAGMA